MAEEQKEIERLRGLLVTSVRRIRAAEKKADEEARTCSTSEKYMYRLLNRLEMISKKGTLNIEGKTMRGNELMMYFREKVY